MIFDFQKFKTMRSFGRDICISNIAVEDAVKEKTILADAINDF